MNRRRILLSYLANSFSWELYSKTYFYNELVPTTINGKNVLNKAKIVKVSGNGVIENQLVQNGDFSNGTTSWYAQNGTIAISNGKMIATCSSAATSYGIRQFLSNTIPSGHKLLFVAKATTTTTTVTNYKFGTSGLNFSQTAIYSNGLYINIGAISNNATYFDFRISGDDIANVQVGDTITIDYIKIIDLTLREGTSNEPTTLTDNRIQNILNRGYIAYNLGKYKESDIGVVSSEPYNLFDGTLNVGGINNDGTDSNDSRFVRSDFISVLAGRGYSFETNFSATDTYWQRLIYEYDKNKNFIKLGTWASDGTISLSLPLTTTLSSNTAFIKIVIYHANDEMVSNPQICVHQSGTRTGYAPHKTFTPITFKAQLGGAINSHNTMEITNSAYVFTRNVWKVDLGSLTYNIGGAITIGLYRYYSEEFSPAMASGSAQDGLCDKYAIDKGTYNQATTQCVRFGQGNNRIYAYLSNNYSTSAEVKNALSGTYAYYPLATPQVITIPRKHLGIIDLGTLTYRKITQYGKTAFETTTALDYPDVSLGSQKIYCHKYMFQNYYQTGNPSDNVMSLANDKELSIYDSSKASMSTTEFAQSLSGTYLFYETQDEVADITDTIDIESGGTITTDSEVLPNIELSVKCK